MAENKNVVDKTNLTTHTGVEVDSTKVASQNWISQIKAGDDVIYDIATHHAITFKDGNDDNVGVKWNGLTDLEIVIPTIKDIVQTPIEFAGTVGADGNIVYNAEHQDGPQTGYLVFFTADCPKFTEEEIACEAGDMAIYDGEKWNVISGENQVAIAGNNGETVTTIEIGDAKEVLTVEGKTLKLALNYTEINDHLHVTKSGNDKVGVKFGNMTVGKTYVKLNKGADVPTTIGEQVTLQKASKLSNGNVDFTGTDSLLTGVKWGTFDAGSLHEIVLNSDKRTFDVTGGSIVQTEDQHFVKEVTLGKVTFGGATAGEADAFTLVNGITPGSGQAFVTNVDGDTKFTVAGCLQPTDGANATYVKGITGDYVTSLNAGSFTLTSGSDLVTGFGAETTTVGDVISSISVTANNDTAVYNKTEVNNHVLEFKTANVASGVTVTPKYKSLEKTGFTYTPTSANKAAFVNGGFTKASDVTYTLGTANETTYTTTSAYYKLTTPELGVSKGGYALSNTGMVANVAENTFAVNVSGGVLPSWSGYDVIKGANITGAVATGLDYVDQPAFYAVAADAVEINLPGAYSLGVGSEGDGIEVGAAGELTAKNATIDLSNYVTNVEINTTDRNTNS